MRIPDALRIVLAGTAFLAVAPAHAFEFKEGAAPAVRSVTPLVPVPPANIPSGNVTTSNLAAPSPAMLSPAMPDGIAPTALAPTDSGLPGTASAFQAFRTGTQAYLAGEKQKAVQDLTYAADQGHALAAWKLARMYAEGDGVKQSHIKAFRYFNKLASDNADTSPYSPQARFVSNAFVAVGGYYQTGIANSEVKPNAARAREMYSYAASYFGDADAQYRLARIYLEDKGGLKDTRQGARWLSLAANKGQHQAQALLGHMLFKGAAGLPHSPARGLMWLSLAREGAAGAEDGWIVEFYDDAYAHSNDEERGLAHTYAQQWASSQR